MFWPRCAGGRACRTITTIWKSFAKTPPNAGWFAIWLRIRRSASCSTDWPCTSAASPIRSSSPWSKPRRIPQAPRWLLGAQYSREPTLRKTRITPRTARHVRVRYWNRGGPGLPLSRGPLTGWGLEAPRQPGVTVRLFSGPLVPNRKTRQPAGPYRSNFRCWNTDS